MPNDFDFNSFVDAMQILEQGAPVDTEITVWTEETGWITLGGKDAK